MPADDDSLPGSEILFDEADCGLLLTAENGQIAQVNLTFCRWIGYRRTELLGRHIQDLMNPEG
ncbi:MAG: PAS domain-containing protein, partial [Pseudomonas sp.]